MLPIFKTIDAKNFDHKAIADYHLSESELIDSVALGVYRSAKEHFINKDVLFLVGKGNNGSDALALCSLILKEAKSVKVLCISQEGNEENMRRRKILPKSVFVSSPSPSDTIVDGLFGFGFDRKLTKELETLIDNINSYNSYVIALDIPSAFRIKADETFTFTLNKIELFYPENREKSGKISLYNPGFPMENAPLSKMFLLSDEDYNIKNFDITDFKNKRGHLLVVGGSERYKGAPILTSLASFHGGVGLVTLSSDKEVLDASFAHYPSIMLLPIDKLSAIKVDAIACGMGWEEGKRDVLEYISKNKIKATLDSGAFSSLLGLTFSYKAVITPHYGEYKRILKLLDFDKEDIVENLKAISRTLEVIVVMKTSVVWITDGESVYLYDGSNPSLGVAGSGDVLSGLIGAFLAFGLEPLEASIMGVILHQKSGKMAQKKFGYYTSEELIEEIGRER